jgi:hypothetical protein
MSSAVKRNPLLSDHSNYSTMHVGGNGGFIDRSNGYIKQNQSIIKHYEQQQYVPKTYIAPYDLMNVGAADAPAYGAAYNGGNCCEFTGPNYENTKEMAEQGKVRFDPVTDFMYKHGLINRDNELRYRTHYINIDSSLRNKYPSYEGSKPQKLGSNPMKLYSEQKGMKCTIKISQQNHKFKVGDKITINGVLSRSIVFRTKVISLAPPFQFTNGSEYLRIFYDDGSEPISCDNPNKKNGGLADIDFDAFNGASSGIAWTDTDQSNLFIKMSGFQGSSPTNQHIGNIPVSTLNRRHKVHLTIPGAKFDNRVVYIKLVRAFSDKNSPYTFQKSYNVGISFEYICGIPLGKINTHTSGQEYQIVASIDKDSYAIDTYNLPGSYTRAFGGTDIYVSKLMNITKGYSNPNQYSINLDKVYSDVIYISLISSEFPNIAKTVRGNDNVFYWQNLDDGNHVYRATLASGYYTAVELARKLENVISSVPRINFSNIKTQYTSENIIKFSIDTCTNNVTISSFKEAKLLQPIVGVSPSSGVNYVDVQIKHIEHGLVEGDRITISGAVAHMGIPADAINGNHAVVSVISNDLYTTRLPNFNYLSDTSITGGGLAFTILVPNIFRIRFDYNDCIGKVLGFKSVGKSTSVTDYNSVITNCDPYEDEIIGGQEDKIPILTRYNYILMMCKQVQVINDSNTKRSNALAKILLSGVPGKTLFNTYVDAPNFFTTPIPQLHKLDLSFITPDGNLCDFDGLDHSFTLKLITIIDKPKGTGISTSTGKISN